VNRQSVEALERNRRCWREAGRRAVELWLRRIRDDDHLDREWPNIDKQLGVMQIEDTLDLVLALEHLMLERAHWQALEICAERARRYCKGNEDKRRFVGFCCALGRLYFRLGRADDAEAVLADGEEVCERIEDDPTRRVVLGTVLYLRGAAARLQGDGAPLTASIHYERSILLCCRSVALKQLTADRRGTASAHFNLGAAQTEMASNLGIRSPEGRRMLRAALGSLRRSLELFREVEDVEHGRRAQIRIARVLLELSRPSRALHVLEGLAIDPRRSPRTFVDRELIRARALEWLSRSHEAIDVATKALEIARSRGMATENRELAALLARGGRPHHAA
jgi:tetratricopeptide (TPR) repeat protein